MVIVAVTSSFDKEMKKKLSKSQYYEVQELLLSLKKDPYKGDVLHVLGSVVLKELKYGLFRFYFFTSHNLIKFVSFTDLEKELIKFVRMSKKNDQQRVIADILKKLRRGSL